MKTLLLLFFFLLHAQAERIITLAPSVNEIVFALGHGDEVVGNSEHCSYPEISKDIPKVGGYFAISLEKVLALRPTLIIMAKNNLPLKPKFEKLGIEVIDVSTVSLQELLQSFKTIGKRIGAKEEALSLIQEVEKALLSTTDILENKKILIVFGSHLDLNRQIYVSGNHLYFADIIKHSNNQNAYHDTSTKQPALSYEGLIATNPDIVIILAPYAKTQKREISAIIKPWLKIPITAATKKTIYVIDKEYAGIPSDRVRFLIKDYEEILRDAKDKLSRL